MNDKRGPDDAPYRVPSLSVEERVTDLLARMTLEEKSAQLACPFALDHPEGVPLDADGLGAVAWPVAAAEAPPRQAVAAANALQRRLVEETRLGIPALFNEEALCGLKVKNATVFPDAIGQAATWDPALIEEMGRVIAAHARLVGARQLLSPLCDVAVDPRWGRVEETYGEDPYLVGSMATAFVRGVQGRDGGSGVIATLKHFIGYGASEGGRNTHPVHVGSRELRETHGVPFEMAIREGGARGVMCAYNQVDRVPAQASPALLTDLLRGEYGFDGLLISDLGSVSQLVTRHCVAADKEEAAALALRAGLDIEMPRDVLAEPLLAAVRAGAVSEAEVDRAVANVLRWKFALGLFEQPYADEAAVGDSLDSEGDRALARRVAEGSIVLLRNEPVDGRPVLPLPAGLRSVAVIGPNADRPFGLLGNYSYPVLHSAVKHFSQAIMDAAQRDGAAADDIDVLDMSERIRTPADDFKPVVDSVPVVTVLEGIRDRVGPDVEVRYAQGCPVQVADPSGLQAAVDAAAASDVAVVVVGDQAGILAAATVGEAIDSVDLALPGLQRTLVERVAATGTPTVVVLTHGRPFVLDWLRDLVPAVVTAWFPGEEGGHAVARVLFGDVNPSGRLPVSMPGDAGSVPAPYNRANAPGNTYYDGELAPVWPFGHGLAYTTFEYRDLRLDVEVPTDGVVSLSCEVVNTGDRAGAEVVQLYARDLVARSARPRIELKGFARVPLEPGEGALVRFRLPADRFALYDPAEGWVVEPGRVQLVVGASSEDIRLRGEVVLTGDVGRPGSGRALVTEVEVERR